MYYLLHKHEQADRLRNYRLVGEHQATFFDSINKTFRGTKNIVGYQWKYGVYWAIIEWNGTTHMVPADEVRILAPAF